MPRIILKPDNFKKINNAIKKVEKKTTGEIAVAISKESADYSGQELRFGILCGFIYYFIIMNFSLTWEKIIQKMFWDYSSHYLLIFFGLSTFLVIFIFFLIANVPVIDRLIISKKIKKRRVKERAQRYFMESGIYNTRDRTGILIFISLLERRVELLVDQGIREKISPEEWDSVVDHIVLGIRKGNFLENLNESVVRCGNLLSGHFPAKSGDVNELVDRVRILEK